MHRLYDIRSLLSPTLCTGRASLHNSICKQIKTDHTIHNWILQVNWNKVGWLVQMVKHWSWHVVSPTCPIPLRRWLGSHPAPQPPSPPSLGGSPPGPTDHTLLFRGHTSDPKSQIMCQTVCVVICKPARTLSYCSNWRRRPLGVLLTSGWGVDSYSPPVDHRDRWPLLVTFSHRL